MPEPENTALRVVPSTDTGGNESTFGPCRGSAVDVERNFADVLANVVSADRVPVDSHFFNDLGADSLLMAQFCARVRKRPDLPDVSMTDIYRHPTIRSLATALTGAVPAAVEKAVPTTAARATARRRAGPPKVFLCGTLQLVIFVAYTSGVGYVAGVGYDWISTGAGVVQVYARAIAFGDVSILALCVLPIVVKWALIGRWKPQEIQIWSLAYVRFWIVKTLIRANPLLLMIGGRSRSSTTSPILNFYLRALGANIGPGVAIFTRTLPVCTDLLTIGQNTVIRKDSFVACYRAQNGVIQTGPVTFGKNVFVGETSVIDIGTSMGDGAQLGHSSSLHTGQSVPAGESWHGSPARRTLVDYRVVNQVNEGRARDALFGVSQLVTTFVVGVPAMVGVVVLALVEIPELNRLLNPEPSAFMGSTLYRDALLVSLALLGGYVIIGLLVVGTVPRALNRMIKPDTVYPLYGFDYGIHKAIARMTNNRFLTMLFGDSSYIVHYLRWVGYDLPTVVQTGSNFGAELKHENPYLTTIGSGTMVADTLSVINADFSSTSFRLSRVSIGAHNFIGNIVTYPAQSRAGDNCLIATKAMVPLDGPVREGIGLLGAPGLHIPRSVDRDTTVNHLRRSEQRRRLTAKNGHNIGTMALYLLVRWLYLIGILLLGSVTTVSDAQWEEQVAAALFGVVTVLFTIFYWVLVERLVMRFRSLQPRICSIYDRAFWRHERYWKVPAQTWIQLFNGTPFKGLVWRRLGVRVGRRLFDDGLTMTERTLVTIGDDCTLNLTSNVQCHSQEDGAFKSDRSTIGNGCTLGVNAFIHYGTDVGDGALIEAHTFLMKGEEVPAGARWHGNPARHHRGRS
jgi:non-ribosomal peptide synthetase-like protein